MAEIVQMLALSPTMEEGHLTKWTVKEGDTVEEGDVIAEVETDKATMELESFFEGVVLKLLVPENTNVPVGDAIAVIGEEGEDPDAALSDAGGGGGGASDAEAAEAPAAPQPEPSKPTSSPDTTASKPGDGERIFASPVARRMARDNGLELGAIEGTGPRGRIVKRDVAQALDAKAAAPAPEPKRAAAPAAMPAPAAPPAEGGERVDLTPMRKTIAQRMTASWTSAPHFALTTEIDVEALMALRSSINGQLKAAEAGLKLSVNDFILKACARALRDVPEMNVAWGGDHLVRYDEVHIGVAVALDGGLITPVVRNADTLTLGDLSRTTRELATRARDKRLKPNEYTGSTFSVSNLGMFGITHFHAVLNPPEAGILAVGAVVEKPVVKDGELTIGRRMSVTLSCDHRSTDGAVGARWLQALRRYLENPVLLTV